MDTETLETSILWVVFQSRSRSNSLLTVVISTLKMSILIDNVYTVHLDFLLHVLAQI